MKRFTRTRLVQSFKVIVFGCLLVTSIWFMKDAWIKYNAKDTSFRVYSQLRWDSHRNLEATDLLSNIYLLILRKEVPTTTICFEPFLKQSILKKYNITINDFYFQSEAFGKVTWIQLQNELFYHNTVDFALDIHLSTVPSQWINGIVEGKNGQSNNETQIILTKLLTFWSGNCYQVT